MFDYDNLENNFLDAKGDWLRPTGQEAKMKIHQYWSEGKCLPGHLAPILKAHMEKDNGFLLPKRTTLKKIKQVVELLCSHAAKGIPEACAMVGKKPPWYYKLRAKHPNVIQDFEREYYRDLEETAERAKWDAKQKSIIAVSEMQEIANRRLMTTLSNDEVAPAVHVSAVKQVHDVLGVVGKRGDSSKIAQSWKPNEVERKILEALTPRDIVVEAEVVDGREDIP